MVRCGNIVFSGNEVARNVLRGLHARDTETVQVRNNLFEGNEAGGLLIEAEAGRGKGIVVTENLVRNNGGQGIEVLGGATGGKVERNRIRDNAHE